MFSYIFYICKYYLHKLAHDDGTKNAFHLTKQMVIKALNKCQNNIIPKDSFEKRITVIGKSTFDEMTNSNAKSAHSKLKKKV